MRQQRGADEANYRPTHEALVTRGRAGRRSPFQGDQPAPTTPAAHAECGATREIPDTFGKD